MTRMIKRRGSGTWPVAKATVTRSACPTAMFGCDLVEKVHFPQNSHNLGDRKCLEKLRKPFVALPDAILFANFAGKSFSTPTRLNTALTVVRASRRALAQGAQGTRLAEM